MRAMWAFIATALVLGSGCAKQDWIDRTLVTVDVTGTWVGTIQGGGETVSFEMRLVLEQAGSRGTGSAWINPTRGFDQNGPIEGTVSGDVFRFRLARGSWDVEATVSGDEMTGMTRTMYLRRVDPPSS